MKTSKENVSIFWCAYWAGFFLRWDEEDLRWVSVDF